MPIFIVTEQVMNGTVTIDTITTGIKARNFQRAKEKLIVALDKISNYYASTNDDKVFVYTTSSVIGRMRNEPLKMLE